LLVKDYGAVFFNTAPFFFFIRILPLQGVGIVVIATFLAA